LFVGIFAVVVVVMLNFGQNLPGCETWRTDAARSILIMFGVPIVVSIAILVMLYGHPEARSGCSEVVASSPSEDMNRT